MTEPSPAVIRGRDTLDPMRASTAIRFAALLCAAAACAPPAPPSRPAGTDSSNPGDGDSGSGSHGGKDTDDTGEDTEPSVPAPRQGLLVAQNWNYSEAPLGDGAGRYRVIYLQASMRSILPQIRAANPEALLIAYQKVGGMRADGGETPSTGVQIQEAEEAWFLHGTDGERLYYCDYEGVAAADIGNRDYQARWLDNVQTRLLRDGFDGVMMDDTNTFPGHCMGERGGTPIAEYPTDAAYGDAVVDFITHVGGALKDAGFVVAPNVAMNPWESVMRSQTLAMLPSITHLTREYWMRWNDSPNFTGDDWLQTLTLMEDAERAGVGFLGMTYGPGEEGVAAGQRYGRASFLLAWDGQQDSAWGYFDGDLDPWTPEWDFAIGTPTAVRTPLGPGWMRPYSHGLVLVNPDDQDTLETALDAPHVDPDGNTVTAVSLAPGQAAILRRADAR